jgi:hypothetical protein
MIKAIRFGWLTLAIVSASAHAAAVDKPFAFGPYVGASYTAVDDPDGSTERSAALSRIGVVSAYTLNRKTMVESEVFYHSDSYSASRSDIGQKVKGIGLAAQYYRNLPLTRSFQPWVGAGLSLNNFKYSDRYTTESEGFLAQRFEDRNSQEIDLLISVKLITAEDRNVSYFYRVSYEYPLDTGIQGVLLNIGVLF